jgi:F0F1-type ATP synthase assembly protein I
MKDEDLTEGEIEDREFEKEKEEGFYQSDAEPESQAESTRKSGLAYGAVITLVGSILFFLAIGWAVDKFFQSSPWGIVIGILFGSIVGFYQFIRISSKL